jgi:hypothetical protein
VKLSDFKKYIQDWVDAFDKDVWVTEYACQSEYPPSLATVVHADALGRLQRRRSVHQGRGVGVPPGRRRVHG